MEAAFLLSELIFLYCNLMRLKGLSVSTVRTCIELTFRHQMLIVGDPLSVCVPSLMACPCRLLPIEALSASIYMYMQARSTCNASVPLNYLVFSRLDLLPLVPSSRLASDHIGAIIVHTVVKGQRCSLISGNLQKF